MVYIDYRLKCSYLHEEWHYLLIVLKVFVGKHYAGVIHCVIIL